MSETKPFAVVDRLNHMADKVRRASLKWAGDNGAPVPDEWWSAAQVYEDAAAEIARLTRELEAGREIIRDLVDDEDAGLIWIGKWLVCTYCDADGLYSVAHADDCPIERARRATRLTPGGSDADE